MLNPDIHAATVYNRRGVSLIEVVLVVALIGLLAALFLPSLRRVRGTTDDVVSASNLRQHGIVFSLYGFDWTGSWSALVRERSFSDAGSASSGDADEPYFLPMSAWPRWLGRSYYGMESSDADRSIFWHPGLCDAGILTGYFYAPTHYTRPEYWDAYTRTDTRREWRGVRIDEVFFPSSKVTFAEIRPGEDGVLMPLVAANVEAGFAFGLSDGSVRRERPSKLTRPFPTGTGLFHREDLMGGIGIYGLHTPGGVYGIDLTPGDRTPTP